MDTVVVELHGHHQIQDVLHQVAIVVNALVLYPGHNFPDCSNLSPLLLDNNNSPNL